MTPLKAGRLLAVELRKTPCRCVHYAMLVSTHPTRTEPRMETCARCAALNAWDRATARKPKPKRESL